MRPLRQEEVQWLFPKSALDNTPSRADGISLIEELERRKDVIMYMRSLIMRVSAQMVPKKEIESTSYRGAMTLGATLVHRFYMRRSLKDFEGPLMAATILWMVTKLEENTLKLRLIVNCALDKFESHMPDSWRAPWKPRDPNDPQPASEGHRYWEDRILTAEQIALEALCFDMFIDQPWVILRRSIKGLNEILEKLLVTQDMSNSSNGRHSDGDKKWGVKVDEAMMNSVAWALLSESSLSPLAILYPTPVISFSAFALILSLVEQMPLSSGLAAASELSNKFDLDVQFGHDGPTGKDLPAVNDCLNSFVEYTKAGLIDDGLLRYMLPEPSVEDKKPFTRRFMLDDDLNEIGVKEKPEELPSIDETGKSRNGGVVEPEAEIKEVISGKDDQSPLDSAHNALPSSKPVL
nr:hypothetical protein L204_00096 [Cryptococcus depauperatus CBS 7855]